MGQSVNLVHCIKCGYPNSKGRTTCFKCNCALVYAELGNKPFDQMTMLSHIFSGFAVLTMIGTVILCCSIADTLQSYNAMNMNSQIAPPLSASKTVLGTFLVGSIVSAYLYAIGRTMKWMSNVRESLDVIAFSRQNTVQQPNELQLAGDSQEL